MKQLEMETTLEQASLWLERGPFEAARDLLRQALSNTPGAAELWVAYAQSLERIGDLSEAERACERALELVPEAEEALLTRASLQAHRGALRDARRAIRRASRSDGRAALSHLLTVYGGAGFQTPSYGEVRELFDVHAPHFDAHIEALEYRGHALLCRRLGEHMAFTRRDLVLDLGCGTGLCGPELKRLGSVLVGVDLSAGMVEQAQARDCYDALFVAEGVYALLTYRADSISVLCAADVLGYVGPLEGVFEEAARVLEPGGYLGFTVEALDSKTRDYALQASRRYAYREGYLVSLAQRFGFDIRALEPETLRREGGAGVVGHVAVLELT